MFFVSDAMAAGEAAAQVGGMEGFLMQVDVYKRQEAGSARRREGQGRDTSAAP